VPRHVLRLRLRSKQGLIQPPLLLVLLQL